MNSNRRDFLRSTLAGVAGVNVALNAHAIPASDAPEKNPFSTDPVALRKLTDRVSVTRVGLGTGVMAHMRRSNLVKMDRDEAINLIRYAYDSGIRFFDMADSYGSHQIIRDALVGKPRESYALLTKVWPHPDSGIPEKERPMPELLFPRFKEELGTDYIDVIQIHCMMTEDWPHVFEPYLESLEKMKTDGLIGAHGVSCHAFGAIKTAVETPWVDTIHVRMNTANTRMDGTLEENQALCQKAHGDGKGIIIMKVLGEGSIKDAEKRKESIQMVTGFEAMDTMVVGLESKEQIDEFLENVQNSLNEIATLRNKKRTRP